MKRLERYVIHVTKNCNMQCKYCYEDDKKSGDSSWEETKVLLDSILEVSQQFEVEFLGGEPLLNFSLIEQVVKYLDEKANVSSYYLTTNGTILTPEIVAFLQRHENVKVGISIDGTKIMNCMRVMKGEDAKNSHDIVLANYQTLRSLIDNNRIIAHMVIHPYNVGYLAEGVKYLYDQGFRFIDIGVVEKVIRLDDFYINEFVKQHRILGEKVRQGQFEGCFISTLHGRPNTGDTRTYVMSGDKVVAETYGRAGRDLEGYSIKKSTSGSFIVDLKLRVYEEFNNWRGM